jgi:Tfp pilus assembly protein PilF
VTAQLIDPKTDNNLWQSEYDKPYRELIAIQADIALQIADQVKAFITSSEKQNIKKNPTDNQEAYQLIQKGLYLWNTGSRDIEEMLEITLKAIKLDPEYADAYAFAGICSLLKASVWGGSEVKFIVTDASTFLHKALEIDKDNCTAHLGLAWFNDWIKWDYAAAEKEFLKVLELEPNNPLYLELYVEFLLKRGHPEQALNYKIFTEQSYRLIQATILAGKNKNIHNLINSYTEKQGSKGLKFAGDCYLWMKEYDSARTCLEDALKSEDKPFMMTPRFQAYLALAYNKTNQPDLAQKIINQLTSRGRQTTGGDPAYFTGWYYSGTGDADSAFIWLEKAYNNRSIQLAWLKADPVFSNLKNDKRYRDLYERTGHKAYDDYFNSQRK